MPRIELLELRRGTSSPLLLLVGFVGVMAFGGTMTSAQDKKAVAPPLRQEPEAPARVAPQEGRLVAPPVFVFVADAVNADAALIQGWEEQFGPQLRQYLRSELHYMRLVTEPTKAQFEKIAADSDGAWKHWVDKYVKAMRGGGNERSDPRMMLANAIAKSADSILSPEQASRYREELVLRTAAKKRMAVSTLVAKTDRILVLSPDQHEKLAQVLTSDWNESMGETQVLKMDGQYFPSMPDEKIMPLLSPAQQSIWRGVAKGNIRFGVHGMFWQVMEVGDEVWDDQPAPKAGGKP